ncbi:MAG: glycerol-3-phosphate 1-O-acyltransferase PlsY [bacterium]|nr:glycerol-3-phosphate 1-O-acyltransferase PlsY [bacterium]
MSTVAVSSYLFVAVVISYLIGSVSFAVIFSKIFANKDVRNYGSGNAGMTNVVRAVGVLPGILTLVFDFLKGFIPCYIVGNYLFESILSETQLWWAQPQIFAQVCGLGCMLGHIFPVFFKFKGGKAVATIAGVYLACNWKVLAVAVGIFVVVFLITRTVSMGSVLAVGVCPFLMMFLYNPGYSVVLQVLLVTASAALVVGKHKDNIVRILNHTEKPLSFKKNR